MARVSPRHLKSVTCLLIFILVSEIVGLEESNLPEFFKLEAKEVSNITVDNVPYTKILFYVLGKNINPEMRVKITQKESQRNTLCQDANFSYNISEIKKPDLKSGQYNLTVPSGVEGKLFFCLPHKVKQVQSALVDPSLFNSGIYEWFHQGPGIFLNVGKEKSQEHQPPIAGLVESRLRREDNVTAISQGTVLETRIRALRVDAAHKEPEFDSHGVPSLLADATHTLRLFGDSLTEDLTISFTTERGSFGSVCQSTSTKRFRAQNGSLHDHRTMAVDINLPPLPSDAEAYYLCIKNGPPDSPVVFIHQGSEDWLQLKTHSTLIPLWASILVILVCITFSSLFSGLNLGLMSLDKTELKILCNTGTPKERKYAQAIQPVRNHGNYLLCSILLGNVLVNSTFTIILDGLTSGVIAVVFSTLAIVLFGEIFPQAVCSRHGLWVGAKTIFITRFVMILTFPLSYTVAKFLDWILGEEIGNVYTRERLKELVMVTTGENDLDKDEVNIISGALELRKKTVADVMTKIEDVFMLDYEAVLDFETITEIMKSGYSRVPVYEGNRQNIVTMLYIKDLAFVDPDDNTPLKTLCQFYQNPCNFVFEDVTLDVMFKIFKEGNKGHMAFVSRVNTEGEGDPFYETIGLITLEDVIEELIQSEIVDETDVITDNRTKRRRKEGVGRKDFTVFADKTEKYKVRMSPQLGLAAYQYLSTTVEPFHSNVISETIIKRLLKQDIVCHIRKNKEWRTDPANVIYQQGKPVDYFVIILEGRVEVTVGKENLVFEGGPFTYFGTQALVQTVGIGASSYPESVPNLTQLVNIDSRLDSHYTNANYDLSKALDSAVHEILLAKLESPAAPAGMGSLESLNIDSMLRHTFIPDYSVRATTEVLYLKIKRSLYLAAKRATLMEKSKRENQSKEQFDEEIDKLLMDEDELSSGRITPRRKSSRNLQNKSTQELINEVHSPKSPSHLSTASPTSRLSARGDVNGSLKSSPVDDENLDQRGEEISLLPKKS